MENLVITYDTLQNGKSGEACVSIPMDDEQAERIKAALMDPLSSQSGRHSTSEMQ